MTTRLCWWDSKNFGDALNPYMFRAFGHKVEYAQSDEADIIAIGSYMERLLTGALFDSYRNDAPIQVWGTGFQFEPRQHLWFKTINQPETFIRPVDIRALRGKVSKSRAERIEGKEFGGIALGDPGLLTGRIFRTNGIAKKYRLGIVCHFTDNGNEVFDDIHHRVRDSIRINVEAPVGNVVEQIASCEAIVSSAMHPLIIADSLRIPNKWINVSTNSISRYKFEDYYSVFGFQPEFFDLNQRIFDENDLKAVRSDYSITDTQIQEIQDSLIETFPLQRKFHRLSIFELLSLRYREAMTRDKVFQRFSERISNRFRRHLRTLNSMGRRS